MTSRTNPRQYQSTLTEQLPALRRGVPNLLPSGNPLSLKREGILRLAYQNVRGVSDTRGLSFPMEIAAMEELQVDIMGMSETNRPWMPHHRYAYDTMMQLRFRSSRTIYTSAPSHDHSQKYQPGGNLLTINRPTTPSGNAWLGAIALRDFSGCFLASPSHTASSTHTGRT
jgi:hypothetical protein